MLVYGDVRRQADPRDEVARRQEAVDAARRLGGPGLPRHAALVGALSAAGEFAQGVADAAFRETGHDAQNGSVHRVACAARRERLGVAAAEIPNRDEIARACTGLPPDPPETPPARGL